MKKLIATLGVAGVLVLTGCSAPVETPAAPPVTPAPTVSETPTPTPTPEPERGTRANPLAPGESRKITNESMWIVGASKPTVVKSDYIVLPLKLGFDWEAAKAQAEEADEPWDVDNEGIDPYGSLTVSFVSAAGRTYDQLTTDATVKNEFWDVGIVYPPTEVIQANVAVSVPSDEVAGGVWRVENFMGEVVFVAVE